MLRLRTYGGFEPLDGLGVRFIASASGPPAAPSSPILTPIDSTSIGVVWTRNATNETGNQIWTSTDGTNFTLNSTAGPGSSGTASGLTASTLYYIRVRAGNGGGFSGYTVTRSASTLAAPAGSVWDLSVPVSNSGGSAATDYMVPVVLTAGVNFRFYNTKSDLSDLRVYDTDGVTALPFKVESYSQSGKTGLVWARVPSVGAGSSHTIHLQYGDTAALSAGDGSKTFLLYEDFSQSAGYVGAKKPTTGGFGTDFEAFGCAMSPDGIHIPYLCRKGTGESDPPYTGKISQNTYNLLTNAWSGFSDVDGVFGVDNDSGSPGGGLAGTTLVTFFTRRNIGPIPGAGTFIAISYRTSTDGGSNWSARQDLNLSGIATDPNAGMVAIGRIIQVGSEYWHPIYNQNTAGSSYTAFFLKSTDGGLTWAPDASHLIYNSSSATLGLTEICVANVSTASRANTLVGLIRTVLGPLYMVVSTDNGVTWSTPAATNLGTDGAQPKIPHLIYDPEDDTLVAVYGDRDHDDIRWSKTSVGSVLTAGQGGSGGPTGWVGPYILFGSVDGADQSYPSCIKLSTNRYAVIWMHRANGTNTQGGTKLTETYFGSVIGTWGQSRYQAIPVSGGQATINSGWLASLGAWGTGVALRGKVAGLTNKLFEFGFSDIVTPAANHNIYDCPGNNSAVLQYTAAGHINALNVANAVADTVDCGASDTTGHIYEIRRNGTASVDYLKDGTQIASIATKVPTGNLRAQLAQWDLQAGNFTLGGSQSVFAVRRYQNPEPTVSMGSVAALGTLTTPGVPTGLTINNVGGDGVGAWSSGSTNTEFFQLGRATVSGGPYTVVVDNIYDLTGTDTAPAAGTYFYAARGKNNTGVSAWSSEVVKTFYPAGTYVLDSFTDTTGTLLTAHSPEVGSGWVMYNGVAFNVQSNRAAVSTQVTVRAYCAINSSHADCTVQGTVNFGTNGLYGGLCGRLSDGSNLYELYLIKANGNLNLVKVAAGVVSVVSTTNVGTLNYSTDYTLKLVFSGSSINCYFNGVLKLTATDTFNQTATRHGFTVINNGVVISGFDMRWDDFSVVA